MRDCGGSSLGLLDFIDIVVDGCVLLIDPIPGEIFHQHGGDADVLGDQQAHGCDIANDYPAFKPPDGIGYSIQEGRGNRIEFI